VSKFIVPTVPTYYQRYRICRYHKSYDASERNRQNCSAYDPKDLDPALVTGDYNVSQKTRH